MNQVQLRCASQNQCAQMFNKCYVGKFVPFKCLIIIAHHFSDTLNAHCQCQQISVDP